MTNMNLREDADYIIREAIKKVLPNEAVVQALKEKTFDAGNIFVVAAGKAAWEMASTAAAVLRERITAGVVCTKYGHVKGEIPYMRCFEGGHPVPDVNSFIGTQAAVDMVSELQKEDTVLFLLSGGASALFEIPLIAEEELADITGQLLACGADIVEINTIRKRLSAVKGGKFAKLCEPARVYSIVLSDILGDPLDMIASGPAYPDSSTSRQALRIVEKYNLKLSQKAVELLHIETPKTLDKIETVITGSVKNFCNAAKAACEERGYRTVLLTDRLNCEAREAGAFLGAIAKSHQDSKESLAYIAGGETVVHLTGNGKGGRNQELVLSAANEIAGLKDTALFSVGSDGTDGPTDAAGGYCDGNTKGLLEKEGFDIFETLKQNNAYPALKKVDGLIITGATGTNVNDVSVLLIKKSSENGKNIQKIDGRYRTVGIDGCKSGWIMAAIRNGELNLYKSGSFIEIVEKLSFDACLVDMVIGLQGNERQIRPDGMARRILKGRASTVFPAPCRKAVYGETKEERLQANMEVLHKKFTSQTDAIIPKMREVDSFLQEHPQFKDRIQESHPEVCFARLNGKVLMTSKHDEEGIRERAEIIAEYFPEVTENWIITTAKQMKCKEDDITDSVCLAITANLLAQGKTETIPKEPMEDDTGLKMQMVIPKGRVGE